MEEDRLISIRIAAKKIIAGALAALLVISVTAMPVYGQEAIRISVDGKALVFGDTLPYIDANSRTMVPLYMLAGPLGLSVQWDGKTRTAIFSKKYLNETYFFYLNDGDAEPDYFVSGQSVFFAIGSKQAVISYDLCRFGEKEAKYVYTKTVNMDTTAIIKNSRTYAPARYLAESFQCSVKWDSALKAANISTVVPIILKQEKGFSVKAIQDQSLIPADQAAYALEIIDQVNAERASRNIPMLRMDVTLMKAAQARAVETTMLFSHTRPGGLSCFSIFSEYGIAYNEGGENLAYGYLTPEEVVSAWMNSEGHRANILKPDYTATGVGCAMNNEGLYYCAELFTAE